jgi:hypothetical protein
MIKIKPKHKHSEKRQKTIINGTTTRTLFPYRPNRKISIATCNALFIESILGFTDIYDDS